MKTRIIVAVIFVPLLFVILFYLPPVVLTLVISAISAIASYELLRAAGASHGRLSIYAATAAAIIPIGYHLGPGDLIFRAVLILLMAFLFADAVFSYHSEKKITLAHLASGLFGGALIPYFLTALVSLKLFENGRFFVLLPFIIAFITDGGAYFTGVFFGKHHPFPHVSPKKTTEGCIGGIMICIASIVVYGVILHFAADLPVDFWAMALYGLVGGLITELGDLAFSLIKREVGIKDYGTLLPGHGGMLDRFDSMVFAAPAIFMLVRLYPAF